MSEIKNAATCYDKYKTNGDIAARQKCMYTASGDMVCNLLGDGVNVILKNTPYVPKCGQIVNSEAPKGRDIETFTSDCQACSWMPNRP